VCWWLSITNEDKISLHTAASHLEPAALGQGPSVSLSASRSKVDSSSLKPEGWPLPQVMGDICLIYHRGTSALAASTGVGASQMTEPMRRQLCGNALWFR